MTPFQPSLNALRSALALIIFAASALGVAVEGPAGEWSAYAADLASSKYSPLDQINRENLPQLKIAWRWKSIDGTHAEEVRKKYNRAHVSNLKATPLMVGGILYITTPLYQAAAIDAATGEQIWSHDPDSWRAAMPAMSLGFNGRGGAYWSDGKDARFLWGTGDGWLIAVDAKTGAPCDGFGEKGRVDLTTGIREAERGKIDRKGRHMWSVASPPTICRDVVIVPCSISDDPMNKEMPPGNIRGYDVRTGKILWNFNTVPQAGETGVETWEGDSWKYSGNTNVWTQISADEELGYFYLPTGTPTNDFYGGHRHGDNLFAESLICLEAKTGRRVWHYQLVHHGLWDYDPPCAPNLIEITVAGKKIKAVAQVMKNGHIFTFDRATGEPVWPIEERPVPDTDIPGEKVSPTQPFPTKPPSFESQGVAIDDLIDFTPELRAEALEIVKHYRIGPLFTPPSLTTEGEDGMKGTIMNPGWGGGANWTGAGFDPETGLLYVPSSQGPIAPVLTKPVPGEGNMNYVRLSIPGVRGPQGLPLLKPPYSRVTAIDMNKGEIAWQVPHGGTSAKVRDHPALKGVSLPPIGTGGKSGPLVTKTLLFVGKRGEPGSKDPADAPVLIAYDKATGAVTGEIPLPASAIGAPMTYLLNGKQYLAVTLLASPPELIAFALQPSS